MDMNKKTKLLLAVATLLPLNGCALWTDFKLPETTMPEQWHGQPQTDEKSVWPDAAWWTQFNSPALTAQIDEASKENFDLQAAVARIRQADAQVRMNGSALLPSIDGGASATRNRTPGGQVSTTGFSNNPRINNSYNATLNASYELDFWGKNWASAESARQLAQASRYDKETVALTVTSSVANNYFDILATRERLKMARDNLDNASQLLDAIRKRFEVGIATALDVAQQESVVATQRATIPPLELHLQQAIDAQALLRGKLPEKLEIADAKLADLTLPVVTAGLPSALLQRRPDVQNAEAQLASAHADIINARAQFFPSIGLTASGGYASTALAQLFRPDSMLWSIGSSVAQPIFEGGLLSGQLELRKARYDELLQDYRKAVVAAFTDVEDSLANVKQSAAEEQAQQVAAEAARKSYALTQQQFKGGVIDITTVLNTQRTLFSAKDALIQAKLAHLQAIVGLYRALGGGWQTDKTVTPDVVVPNVAVG